MVGWEASIGLAPRVSGEHAANGSGQRVFRPEGDCLKDLHCANTSVVYALDCSPSGCDFNVVATPVAQPCGCKNCRVGLLFCYASFLLIICGLRSFPNAKS